MADLAHIAEQISAEMGPTYTWRAPYAFPVPANGGLTLHSLEAAVFSSPVPSLHSAFLALTTAARDASFGEIGYFGSPLALVSQNGTLRLLRYRAPLMTEQIGSFPADAEPTWIRSATLAAPESQAQLSLLAEGRDLILFEAKRALAELVRRLMRNLAKTLQISELEAFTTAMAGVRSLVFLGEVPPELQKHLDTHMAQALTFAHLPIEAVAELYETLALSTADRKRLGVVYTPGWVARYLVRRLPSTAFTEVAVDPTCGSGTFLVAYLERRAEECARRHLGVTSDGLVHAVAGMDVDPVALETTRLSLDLFLQRIGAPPGDWNLSLGDATQKVIHAPVVVSNLPFGHRTHAGRFDVSSVIVEKWLGTGSDCEQLGLILPDSFAYSDKSQRARSFLRSRFRLDEILELPEEVFERTSAPTLAVVAGKGQDTESVLVRRISRRALRTFRLSGVAASFAARLPPLRSDPWTLSPFYAELSQAERRKASTLGELADIHTGFQAYGAPEEVFAEKAHGDGPPVMEDPKMFARYEANTWSELRRFTGSAEVLRRPGPARQYASPKIVIRAHTNPRQRGRLAAVVDTHGMWFSAKFVGIFLSETVDFSIEALAAYLQTRFCDVWFATNNPSRTLRVTILARLPIPDLPREWWARAERLVTPNTLVVAPRWRQPEQPSLFEEGLAVDAKSEDWEWFEAAVEASLGIAAPAAASMSEFLEEYLDVGGAIT